MKFKKAYALIDIIVSITCILTLSMPIIKTFDIIERRRQSYTENKILLKSMDEVFEYIVNSDEIINEKLDIRNYTVSISLDNKIEDKLYKYKIIIYEKEDKNNIKSAFYMMKAYE